MSGLLVMALGADVLSAGPQMDRFDCAADAPISTLRQQVREHPATPAAYVLAVGEGEPGAVEEADWQQDVIGPLRQAFGFVTGAARRLRDRGESGTILFLLPSAALLPAGLSVARSVLLRALLGMAEALRAELGASTIGASIVFHAPDEGEAALAARIGHAVKQAPMYSLSSDLNGTRIRDYFAPLLAAIDATSAGPPLPDIGPMAMVYDLDSIGPLPA